MNSGAGNTLGATIFGDGLADGQMWIREGADSASCHGDPRYQTPRAVRLAHVRLFR
jgi:hypothetical protein